MNNEIIAIIGGGQAAAMAAASLRQQGSAANCISFRMSRTCPMSARHCRKQCCWTIARSFSRCLPRVVAGE
jgi:lysine/ornithine N-monooxygenase